LKRALRFALSELGPEAGATATVMDELSVVYFSQGRYSEAEPLMERSLAIIERERGSEHWTVAAPD